MKDESNLATIEQHTSFYTYTLTIYLSRIGIDADVELANEEKATRVNQLLEVTKFLNREIRGRQENLAPLFIIGGIYPIPNPFFLGRIELQDGNDDEINISLLKDTLHSTALGMPIKDVTHLGYVQGTFKNEDELNDLMKKDRK